ncbi:hypothetical protein ASG73_03685 [Janibacter sp. Soil728]|uniref:Flp family type IVb pilin n=1 Tax=Janibacter sp. Soil728 TaxID=1736393 RepID=UPI0006F9ED53|nr:Flp family type IVb pilin [Janibacter sp. Soil728]KRE39434.1 hypothetical protein ASG73_03685 [Janibacter sp. Soil728]
MLELYINVLRHRIQAISEMREKGATAVEYGIMVALIAAVIIGIVATIGTKLSTAFTTVRDALPV